MITVKVKPLTVNRAYRGRKYKTPMHDAFKQEVYYKLPPKLDIPTGPLFVYYIFGVSTPTIDWDNPIKMFQDVLQDKYGFNDNQITMGLVEKVRVKKEEEFCQFVICGAGDVQEAVRSAALATSDRGEEGVGGSTDNKDRE